jgi:myo-inositol-1(or 4)-monophosphatase
MSTAKPDLDLPSILDFCVTLARKAGVFILEASEALLEVGSTTTEEKSSSVDIVTEYDVKVEELLFSSMRESYPNFKL